MTIWKFPISRWKGFIDNTIKETEHYPVLFHRLEQNAAEEDKELFQYIVAHDEGSRRSAELEQENSETDTLKPLTDLLAY